MEQNKQMELKSILPARRVDKEQSWTDCDGIKGLTFVIKPYQRGCRKQHLNNDYLVKFGRLVLQ